MSKTIFLVRWREGGIACEKVFRSLRSALRHFLQPTPADAEMLGYAAQQLDAFREAADHLAANPFYDNSFHGIEIKPREEFGFMVFNIDNPYGCDFTITAMELWDEQI